MAKQQVSQLIQNTILTQLGSHRRVLVAYSGGIDSTVLLHALVTLKLEKLPDLQLTAIYIHHGISANADQWALHCQQQCQRWQVPFVIEKVTQIGRASGRERG